ncbi:MAG TPA: hypothetical protein PLJ99_08485, partial [Kiritimatiellia bacterium]|nr:hypothetical protein [Kiritimatiellia bacterium]HPR69312.1 hypothetical protein [Kiritimatiellia bacterium]HRX06925.1 hypothetical protein [Kiritimatiellia bacterium]
MGAPVIYKTLKENTGGQDLGQSQNPMGFPQHGKLFEEFSTVWKLFSRLWKTDKMSQRECANCRK